MQWVFLAIAIAFEVGGTLSLRVASTGRRAFYAAVALGYGLAFVFLSLALGEGLGLGVAYGIWAACGVALIALASTVLFNERITALMAVGMALVIVGVVVVELGTPH